MSPAVIAMILVILLAVMVIMAAVLLKKRPIIAPVMVTDHEEGHVHDNVRLYHEEGGGEEDNLGFDITKLMKYTYIETTIPPRPHDSHITEGDVDVPESEPLLQGAPPPSSGPTFGLTGTRGPGPKMPKYMDGDDIGDFITTRVTITNREVRFYKNDDDD
jgi:protocadherin Fat 1/2/3